MTILWDHDEEKDRNMMPPVKEIEFSVDFSPLKVVVAVVAIIVVLLILIAAGSGEVSVFKVGAL